MDAMPPIRPMEDLRASGLLWLINRVAFHPYGLALGLVYEQNGQCLGWTLQGNGAEPFTFEPELERQLHVEAMATLQEARQQSVTDPLAAAPRPGGGSMSDA